jgi:hypothetical protein
MRKTTRKLAGVASGIIVAAGGLTTGAATAGAAPQARTSAKPGAVSATAASQGRRSAEAGPAACSTHSYVKPEGFNHYPGNFPGGNWLYASSGCGNIWVYPSTNRYVRLCFAYSNGVQCQSGYVYAYANSWTRLATGVSAGTWYKFAFQTSGRSSGYFNG